MKVHFDLKFHFPALITLERERGREGENKDKRKCFSLKNLDNRISEFSVI